MKIIRDIALHPLGDIPGNATIKSELEVATGMHYRNPFPNKLWLTRAYLGICISGHMIKIGHLVLVSGHQRSPPPACTFLMTDPTTMVIMEGWAGHLQAKILDTFLLYHLHILSHLRNPLETERKPTGVPTRSNRGNSLRESKQIIVQITYLDCIRSEGKLILQQLVLK